MELPDFDSLMKLARNNPEEFEMLRETLIEDAILSAKTDNHRRLRGLQFQIDMTRRKAKTPLAACIRISSLMQSSLIELRDFINGPHEHSDFPSEPQAVAKILDFKTPNSPVSAV